MVADPADYRWSSYGAAMGGDKAARSGLEAVVSTVVEGGANEANRDWKKQAQAQSNAKRLANGARWLEQYRVWLFGSAEEVKDTRIGKVLRKGMSFEKIQAVLKEGGKVKRWEMLRCRLRYMTQGGALGTKVFVEELFHAERWRFSEKRVEGAKPMRGGDSVWSGLRTLRSPRWSLGR